MLSCLSLWFRLFVGDLRERMQSPMCSGGDLRGEPTVHPGGGIRRTPLWARRCGGLTAPLRKRPAWGAGLSCTYVSRRVPASPSLSDGASLSDSGCPIVARTSPRRAPTRRLLPSDAGRHRRLHVHADAAKDAFRRRWGT